jgi:general stress protein YciG
MANNESMNSGHRSTRGFASMDPAKRREIAKKGGHAAHQKGTAHEFTPEEARAAGRKGGERSRAMHSMAKGSADGIVGDGAQNGSSPADETARESQLAATDGTGGGEHSG